jgi:hypothetical protein
MKLKLFALVLAILINGNVFGEEKSTDISTVVSEGVGVDPQSAAQNAAENALKNVVGSFMDTNTLLEKRTVIDNGIQSQSKNISKDIKEYSQGSIKSFEIIDTKQESGLIRMSAKVGIRKENFSAYIKKLAEGETKIDAGLFAQVATEIKQDKSIVDIIMNGIISPIISGEVQEFEIEKPMLFKQAVQVIPDTSETRMLQSKSEKNSIIVLKVNTFLNKDFKENMNNILRLNSNDYKTVEFDKNKQQIIYNPSLSGSCKPNWCIGKINEINAKSMDFFEFKNIYEKISKKTGEYNEYSDARIISNDTPLKITITDANGSILFFKKIIYGQKNEEVGVIPIRFSWNSAWSLVKKLNPHDFLSVILENDSFYIWMSLDIKILEKADKIVVSLGEHTNKNIKEKTSATENKKYDSNPKILDAKPIESQIKQSQEVKNKSESSTPKLQEIKIKNIMNIKQKINNNWKESIKTADFSLLNPEMVSKFKCVVMATLDADGKVLDTAIQENSSYAGFDSLAENTVKKSAPLSVPKDEELFDRSFKIMTFSFDRNSVEVRASE